MSNSPRNIYPGYVFLITYAFPHDKKKSLVGHYGIVQDLLSGCEWGIYES